MNEHTSVERQLKSDIMSKNLMRKSLQKKIRSVSSWSEMTSKSPKKQQKKRILESIDRYNAEIGRLKKTLFAANEALRKRILEEMAFSEEEVKAFQSELDKEVKAARKIREALDATAKAESKAKNAEEIRLKKRRLEKQLNEESKKILENKAELISEERDKALFTLELKRIALEQEVYRPHDA